MTVSEALSRATDIIGEASDNVLLTDWLAEIESTVCGEIGATHEGASFDTTPITTQTDGDRVLFVPDPQSQLYVLYLIMKNDMYLRDAEQYNNSAAAFEAAYSAFADRYNREHMPRTSGRICL